MRLDLAGWAPGRARGAGDGCRAAVSRDQAIERASGRFDGRSADFGTSPDPATLSGPTPRTVPARPAHRTGLPSDTTPDEPPTRSVHMNAIDRLGTGSTARSARPRHRDELRRDRHRHRARHDAARQHDRDLDGRARALRRRRARGRRPGAPRGARADDRRGARRGRRHARRPRRRRRHQRPGPRRRAHGRRRRGEGARALARQARSTPSTTSSATSAPTCSTPTAPPLELPDRRAARLGRAHLAAARARPRPRRRAARRDDRRRRGRGLRQGRAAARPAVSRRPRDRPGRGDRRRPEGDPVPARAHRSPRTWPTHRYDFSLLGAEDRGRPLGRAARGRRRAGARSPMSRRASARPSSTCSSTKAHRRVPDLGVPRLLLGGGVVANARLREVAIERADAAGIDRCASRRCRSAPTTAR